MISIPAIAYALAISFMGLAFFLAAENTIISAEVLSSLSGASVISSACIAFSTTALEMCFASWLMKEDSMLSIRDQLHKNPARTCSRLFFGGLGLSLVYHFDVSTTYRHPQFHHENLYFFWVVVCFFVFGPEIILCVGWWLWNKARDEETKMMAATNHKAAENAFRRAERLRLVDMAKAAGNAHAESRAASRWGPGSQSDQRKAP